MCYMQNIVNIGIYKIKEERNATESKKKNPKRHNPKGHFNNLYHSSVSHSQTLIIDIHLGYNF